MPTLEEHIAGSLHVDSRGELEFTGGELRWSGEAIEVHAVALSSFRLTESAAGTIQVSRTQKKPEDGGLRGRFVDTYLLVELRDPRGLELRLCTAPGEIEIDSLPLRDVSGAYVSLNQMTEVLVAAQRLGTKFAHLNVDALARQVEEAAASEAAAEEAARRAKAAAREAEAARRAKEAEEAKRDDTRIVAHKEAADSKKASRKKLLYVGMWVGIIGLFISPLLVPASCCIALFGGNWEVRGTQLAGTDEEPVLVLSLYTDYPSDSSAYLIVAVDLADGDLMGRYSSKSALHLQPGGTDVVWISQGEYPIGLALPDLEERYDLEDLLESHEDLANIIERVDFDGDGYPIIDAQDGYSYRLDPQSNTIEKLALGLDIHDLRRNQERCTFGHSLPDTRDGQTLLKGKHHCDASVGWNGIPLAFGSWQTLEGDNGKLRFGVVDDTIVWSHREEDLFEIRDADESGRRIRWTGYVHDRVVVVIDDGATHEDVYVLAMDRTTGEIIWQTTIE